MYFQLPCPNTKQNTFIGFDLRLNINFLFCTTTTYTAESSAVQANNNNDIISDADACEMVVEPQSVQQGQQVKDKGGEVAEQSQGGAVETGKHVDSGEDAILANLSTMLEECFTLFTGVSFSVDLFMCLFIDD